MRGLDLIPWRTVTFASLWILGLAIALTALGFADFHASQQRLRARELLRRAGYRMAINAGLALFCLGQLGSSGAWWEKALWGVLALSFAYSAWTAYRKRSNPGGDRPVDEHPKPPTSV
jgi:hypothetical protein